MSLPLTQVTVIFLDVAAAFTFASAIILAASDFASAIIFSAAALSAAAFDSASCLAFSSAAAFASASCLAISFRDARQQGRAPPLYYSSTDN